jgi:hypothetical protein
MVTRRWSLVAGSDWPSAGFFSSISLAVGPIISACRASSSGLPHMIVGWARSTAISANPAVAPDWEEFAPDSPLEGGGFEPSVPGHL